MARLLCTALLVLQLGFPLAAQNPDVDAVREMSRRLERALIASDTKTLDQLLTDDFVRTPPNGRDTNKAEYLSIIASGELKYFSFQNREEKFHSYPNTVILNQLSDVRGRTGTAPELEVRLKLLWVWIKRDGSWRLAAVQGTRLSGQ